MNENIFKYLSVFSGVVVAILAFSLNGWWTYSLPVYAFIFIPLFERILPNSEYNYTEKEEKDRLSNKFYDIVLYTIIPVNWLLLVYFLYSVSQSGQEAYEIFGRIFSMGVVCVILGINVGHELGHRKSLFERFLAKNLLLTSLYMHFIIEHNRGHHKRVATPEDPASARVGESLYVFWIRSIVMSYISAWKLEVTRLKKLNKSVFSINNLMIQFFILEVILIVAVYIVFGFLPMLYFLGAATYGILFFETVNYLEHYGLTRKKLDNGRYEKVSPIHSWNSNYFFERAILFEVTRHSDHHYKASRKYQILKHWKDSPKLPFGYAFMILASLMPPLWFTIMHKHMKKIKVWPG